MTAVSRACARNTLKRCLSCSHPERILNPKRTPEPQPFAFALAVALSELEDELEDDVGGGRAAGGGGEGRGGRRGGQSEREAREDKAEDMLDDDEMGDFIVDEGNEGAKRRNARRAAGAMPGLDARAFEVCPGVGKGFRQEVVGAMPRLDARAFDLRPGGVAMRSWGPRITG